MVRSHPWPLLGGVVMFSLSVSGFSLIPPTIQKPTTDSMLVMQWTGESGDSAQFSPNRPGKWVQKLKKWIEEVKVNGYFLEICFVLF